MLQLPLGQGPPRGLMVTDLEQVIASFFPRAEVSRFILTGQGIGGDRRVEQVDFG